MRMLTTLFGLFFFQKKTTVVEPTAVTVLPDGMQEKLELVGFGLPDVNGEYHFDTTKSNEDAVRYFHTEHPRAYIEYNLSGSWNGHTWRFYNDGIRYYSEEDNPSGPAIGPTAADDLVLPVGVIQIPPDGPPPQAP